MQSEIQLGTLSPESEARRKPRVAFTGVDEDKIDDRKNIHTIESGSRLVRPRMSLLGKPLNYKAHKRDARYRRAQARIYNFLERPKNWRSISYHLLV